MRSTHLTRTLHSAICLIAFPLCALSSGAQVAPKPGAATKPTFADLVKLAGIIDTHEDQRIQSLYCEGRVRVGPSPSDVERVSLAFRAPDGAALAVWDERDGTPVLRICSGQGFFYDAVKHEVLHAAPVFPTFVFDVSKGHYQFQPGWRVASSGSSIRLDFRSLLSDPTGTVKDRGDGAFVVSTLRESSTTEAVIDPGLAFPCTSLTLSLRPGGEVMMAMDRVSVNRGVDDAAFTFPKKGAMQAAQLPLREVTELDYSENAQSLSESVLRSMMAAPLRVKPDNRETIRQAKAKWGVDEADWNQIIEMDKRIAPSLRALFPKMPATQPTAR
jgi:hypothetical protein